MSFRLSFHQALLGLSGAHWLDDPPDLSCQDSTGQHAVDDPLPSCNSRSGVRAPRQLPKQQDSKRLAVGVARTGTMAGVDADVVIVTHLFAPERASLIELLSVLTAGQWQAPTVCPGWSVKDVALHLLGDDIDLLSRRRDGAAPDDTPSRPAGFQELVMSLDRLNQAWVEATRRISTRLLCELLAVTGGGDRALPGRPGAV